jgi:hypothetical protein
VLTATPFARASAHGAQPRCAISFDTLESSVMPVKADDFTIGVEEEYQVINPETRELRPRVSRLLPKAREDLGVGDEVTNELYPEPGHRSPPAI